MSLKGSASKSMSLLPSGSTDFLYRRAVELFGFLLLAIALLGAVALIDYSPNDPNFNHATDNPASNILGSAGSHVADLVLQTIGLSSIGLLLGFVAWAWRIMSHRGLRWGWVHVALMPVGLSLMAATLAAIPASEGWPLNAGYGGIVGEVIFNNLMVLGQKAGVIIPGSILSLVLGLLGLAALIVAYALPLQEWQSMARGVISGGKYAYKVGSSLKGVRGKTDADQEEEPIVLGGTEEPEVSKPEKKAKPKRISLRKKKEPEAEPSLVREPKIEARKQEAKAGKRVTAEKQAALDLGPSDVYQLPPLGLLALQDEKKVNKPLSEEALQNNARLLEGVLDDYGIKGEISRVRPGPVVTLYELEPAPGLKSSRVIGLADDIARSMSAISTRIAVIPGRNAIGIELPNARRETVFLRDLLSTAAYESTSSKLTLALGKDIGGDPVVADLARMPHLLIAGTTGSGKSVAVNTMILSLLYRLSPEECRFIMIDPKMLELSVYDGIPHLLAPVVTEPDKAVSALKWAVKEMENRYRKMAELGVRNIDGYNQRIREAKKRGEEIKRTVQTGFDETTGEPVFEERPLDTDPLPMIVIIVDEMADLMMVAGKEIEGAVQRLAQMARAAGLHVIMATQRPSVDVITGTIKANFPTRISFQVTSKIDSRTVLGEQGAEQLLGQGDMLFMPGAGRVQRVHGPFVSDEEVEKIVSFLKDQGQPDYVEEVTEESEPGIPGIGGGSSDGPVDALYDQAVALVCRERKASTSFVQRHLQIGYNRAARIIDEMEKEGVISSANHVGKREVLARDIEDPYN
ncbi:cell division protein FtsK [Sneathiella sp. P13V-1]|uniref:FtsK/SpoIIIE family DNA translocase n=1 Tax=Sneathiella sp. P13V-1 TaxID=2697366 RepID=UPI00187B8317|nr:DNA translocase FtsK 4TM domain-containing protein [Sneathiella sp. P13V-1]MBE7636203.1 cell division protein FtsK [Sneathiella sp. P13V-1]